MNTFHMDSSCYLWNCPLAQQYTGWVGISSVQNIAGTPSLELLLRIINLYVWMIMCVKPVFKVFPSANWWVKSKVTSSHMESQVYICNVYNEHRMVVSRSCGQRRKCVKSLCIHSYKTRMGCVDMGDMVACCYTVCTGKYWSRWRTLLHCSWPIPGAFIIYSSYCGRLTYTVLQCVWVMLEDNFTILVYIGNNEVGPYLPTFQTIITQCCIVTFTWVPSIIVTMLLELFCYGCPSKDSGICGVSSASSLLPVVFIGQKWKHDSQIKVR